MDRMPGKALAAGALAALTVGVTACVGSASTTTRPPTRAAPTTRARSAQPIGNTAETVMGTLVAPPTPAFLARVRNGKMGGVLLLGNGWLSRSTAESVTTQLQQAACTRGEPLLIGVDQEGGIVRRLYWAPPTEAPAQMKSAAVARSQATAAGKALKSVGIDVDFAPVVDTPGSPSNFLGTRAFSRNRYTNAKLGGAFVNGLQSNGVAATAKHFPGLGLAGGNTDNGEIVINAAAWKIKQGLLPFQRAIQAGVKLVMVSTAIYPALDASRKPAAFSSKIVQGILRQQLGFQGVAVTDSLTAPAAEATPHAATRAIDAGADLLLFGDESASKTGLATLSADAATSAHLRAQLAQSAGRIRALKAWLAAHGGPTCP